MDIDTWLWVLPLSIGASLLALAGLAAFLWWRIQTSDEKKLARRIAKLSFRGKLSLARALFGDPRVSAVPGVIAVALILYLAMPIDIVPDFIPVLGYVDDLLVIVIGAGLLLRSIPSRVLDEHLATLEARAAERQAGTDARPPRRLASGG